nr:pBE-S-Yng-MO [synthetic construct]
MKVCQKSIVRFLVSLIIGTFVISVPFMANAAAGAHMQGPGRQPDFQRCCQQLRNISPPCRCPSLRQAVQLTHQQQGQVGPQQVRQMYRVASNIPSTSRHHHHHH